MTIEIKDRYTDRVLYSSDKAKDIKECLEEAVKADANLQYANLQGANLQYANGFNKYAVQPLLMLLDQPGKLRFYKAVTKTLESPTSDIVIQYKIGGKVSVEDANTDEYNLCAAGINVTTLDWVLREYRCTPVRILVIECTANDIACIPVASDGKIRLHRGKVVAELDYERYGLKNPMETANSIVTGD